MAFGQIFKIWTKKFLNSILIQISYSAFDEELGCSGNGGEGWVVGAFESSVLSLTRMVLSFVAVDLGVQGEKHILKCFVSYLVIVGCFGDWDLEKFWGLEVESIWDALKVRSDETTMEVTQSGGTTRIIR